MSDAPSPPPAPDYTGAAVATSAGNLDAARLASRANRVDQYTPYGSQTYQDLGNDRWRSDINLSPTGEALLGSANQTQLGIAGLQQGAEKRLADAYASPMDQTSVQQTADRAYKDYTARLDPQWAARTQSQENALVNQGLRPGSEAYDNAMRDFNAAKNDAYTQANAASIATMPQTYQLATAQRNQPLNETNALLTGAQVTNPIFSQAPQQQTTAGPNYLGAAQGQAQYGQGLYNSQVGQANSFNTGLMSAAAAALPLLFSDRRLKSNVKRIGTHRLGIGIYEYDLLGERAVGVMSDEVLRVKPSAVYRQPNCFDMVDYRSL